MSANFTPDMTGYKGLSPFRFWCQKTLPLVYDDSLSYYELLCKVVNYINNLITDVSAAEENVDKLLTAYNQLQEYVNNYFDGADFQQKIDDSLDRYAEDGTLSRMVNTHVAALLPYEVGQQIGPVVDEDLGPVVDLKLPAVVESKIAAPVATQLPAVVQTQIGGVVGNQIGDVVADQIDEVVADQITDAVSPLVHDEVTGLIRPAVATELPAALQVYLPPEVQTQLPGAIGTDLETIAPPVIEDWLDAHPEATTSVPDGSISFSKLATDLQRKAGIVGTYFPSDFTNEYAWQVNQYAVYQGIVYRCIKTTTAGQAWNASEWTTANMNSDLFYMWWCLNYLSQSITTIDSSPATSAHDAGEYFIYYDGAHLYRLAKASSNIAVGDTLTVNGNFIYSSVANMIADLKVEIADLKSDVDDLESALENVAPIVTSENLLNPDNIGVGLYNTTGAYSDNDAYRNSGFIPVTSGETLYFSYWTVPPYAGSGIGRGMSARFLCAYNADKTPIPESGVERVQSYTVPNGVAYIIFSWSYSTYSQYQYMVTVGDSIPGQFEPYYEYRKIAEDVKLPNYTQLLSNIASAALSNTTETLLANESIKIANAPRFVKKNVGLSFYGKFSDSFVGVNVGKGYLLYRGKWLVITPTTVSVHNDTTDTIIDTKSHGLTISDYIAVNMFMGDDGILHYSINTISGSYANTCDISNEFNYAPFAIAAQNMTDCKISVSYPDIKCPIWVIGDSYCGYNTNRVMGNIRQLGFTNFLVDAVAGGVASDNVLGDGDKSMFTDFMRLAAFALPKILIWACGMNGAESMNITMIGYVVKFCADNNIDLILYKTPNVPTLNHDQLNTFIESTGKRYIDAFAAVSADNAGAWYSGFLADDNVHPTVIGAEALAQRWLIDAPELMRS